MGLSVHFERLFIEQLIPEGSYIYSHRLFAVVYFLTLKVEQFQFSPSQACLFFFNLEKNWVRWSRAAVPRSLFSSESGQGVAGQRFPRNRVSGSPSR